MTVCWFGVPLSAVAVTLQVEVPILLRVHDQFPFGSATRFARTSPVKLVSCTFAPGRAVPRNVNEVFATYPVAGSVWVTVQV